MLKLIAAAVTAAALMTLPTLASAQTAAPAAKTEKTTNAKTSKKTLSPAQAAMRERQKKCGAEWKVAKAAGKTQKGQTWPQYWSACNKRLKGA